MGSRIQRWVAAMTGHWAFWVILFSGSLSVPLVKSVTRELPPPPGIYGLVPDFELVDEEGAEFTAQRLRGRVWVANFIFTSCAEVCPRLSSRMRELQDRLANMGGAVHLVSFSVDPTRDTPEKLKEYAAEYAARKDVWSFVTGPIDALEKTVVDGFHMAMAREEIADTGFFDIVHGERFVLVDQLGQIRGYYASDDEGLQALLNELGLLANLGPRVSETEANVVS
jgi:protein SCO1/2